MKRFVTYFAGACLLGFPILAAASKLLLTLESQRKMWASLDDAVPFLVVIWFLSGAVLIVQLAAVVVKHFLRANGSLNP